MPNYINQTLKDWMLGLSVAVFVSIDIVVLVIYTAVEALHGSLNAILMPNDEHAILLVGVSTYREFNMPLAIQHNHCPIIFSTSLQVLKFGTSFMSAIPKAETLP